ncbi:carbon-monoxide dehydrogenase medium subunit [Pseudonocardia sulfidoxydans NBRC 16205]|uniref:Carbon-monoxide dehydrogenase medium subunit n=1 Tax=Pseudonocardia sulfidoxydans NBRC 16205 TaxID=1223511 RepID=A0A511DQK4_9PSEU|nr:xanthine dehydrogenase family protein subunit M [Pseudonocardia sulfidoxydans]GEL27121.1 carbon-monoxide dehydrogenase medium subunit [Pseudonocardia sulfidoxydans NBRC 16205]
MKPPVFDYLDPRTVDEVLDLLADQECDVAILAGGQSLVPLLNLRLARPDVVVDINRIAGLDQVAVTDSAVLIGAMARLSVLEHDGNLVEVLPVVPEAIGLVAHPQIRNRTTIGGSLCHADPSAELPAVAVALGATMHLRSSAGVREQSAAEFFQTVFTTSRRPDELLTAVEFPRHAGFRFCFEEVSRRHGDFPFVGLCLGLRVANGVVVEARLAVCGVAERPVRLAGAESAFVGMPLPSDLAPVLDAASSEVEPPTDTHGSSSYRRALLRTLLRRAVARFDQGVQR